MTVTCAQWNHDGSLLALGGTQKFQDGKELCCVQFYTTFGQVRAPCTLLTCLEVLCIADIVHLTSTRPEPVWRVLGGEWTEGSNGCRASYLLR